MSNIIQDITSLISSDVLSKAATDLGENESGISKVISGLAPTILAGMLNKSNDAGAFGKIFDMAKGQANSGVLDNIGGLLGNNNNSSMVEGLVSSLFGNKMGGILDIVTSLAGVKKSSSSGLMGMITPLIMSYLGKKIISGGLNAMGLSKLLGGQRSNISAALPAGISDLIGFSAKDPVAHNVKQPNIELPSSGGGGNNFFKYLIPLILLGAIYFGWKSCGTDIKNVAENTADLTESAVSNVADKATDAAGAISDAAGDAIAGLGSFFKRKLANGIELNIPEFGIESKLLNFLEGNDPLDDNTWYTFDRLTFATGSSDLDMSTSKEQLDNIAAILKAYPDMEIKIGGYTDNTGSAEGNMKLSQDRADKVAQAIVNAGIKASRIVTEGYGAAHAVASNATEEGRALNRRIAVKLTKK